MMRVATYVSPAQAVAAVRDGGYTDYGFGGSFPDLLDNALATRTGSVRRVTVHDGLVITPKITVLEADPEGQSFRYENIHLGDYERKQYRAGRIAFVPITLRLVSFLYRQGKFRLDVTFVPVSRPDAEGNVSPGTGCYPQKTIIDCARTVIFELNEHLPFLLGVDGSNLCRLDEADTVVEGTHAPLTECTYRAPLEIDRRIAEPVMDEIPDGAVLSLGVGTVPFAIVSVLADSDKKDLGCHTGTISDAYRKLYLAGKLTNARREFNTGRSSSNLAMGNSDFYGRLRKNPDLFRPDSIDYIHDPAHIAKLSRIISINGGVQVDLMGQENAEPANGMQLSGIGGQMDFLEGAFRSAGGCGYICINSSRLTKDGVWKSNIFPSIPGDNTVSIPRTLIEAVATEYGTAHLTGKSLAEHREATIAIAYPDFRDAFRLEKPDPSPFLRRGRKGIVFMNFNLLSITLIIFSCTFFNKISFRFGIPTLFAFILLGMAFGSDGFARIFFDNFVPLETACSVALIFIMFYGGFGTNWKMTRPVARQSIPLSMAGVSLTTLFLGLSFFLPIRHELWLCFLTGSIFASTNTASAFSVLRPWKLNLEENTASISELESGSNDLMTYVLILIYLSFLTGKADVGSILRLLTAQLVFGIAIGVLCGLLPYRILKSVSFEIGGFNVISIAGTVLFPYTLSTAPGGNGYLPIYLAGTILGSVEMNGKKNIIRFFSGLTGLMQIAIFSLLGLLATPSLLPGVLISAVSVFLFLIPIARPLAMELLFLPFRASKGQSHLIPSAGLRGASSTIFAIMAVQTSKSDTCFSHIIFFVVLLSLPPQGDLLPFVAQRFNMVDLNNDVMRTLTDYSEELPMQFIQLTLAEGNKWVGKRISELSLPPQFLLPFIVRGEQKLVPKGNTLLEAGDSLTLCAPAIQTRNAIQPSEIETDKSSEHLHCHIRDIKLPRGEIISLIQRGNQSIAPNGQTEILAGDVLMLTRLKEKTRSPR